MSILRKKLNVKPSLPDHIKNSIAIWRPLHLAICAAFSDLTQRPWEPCRIELGLGELKELQSGLPERGLCFGYGDAEEGCIILSLYDAEFAAWATSRSLAIVGGPVGSDYLTSTLDLMLFKPVAEAFQTQLRALFAAAQKDSGEIFKQIGQKLSPKEFELPKDIGVWNNITFNIQQAEDEITKPADAADIPTTKKSGKRKTESKFSGKTTPLAFTVLLPQSLLQHLLASCISDAGPPIIDPDNPWTDHMRRSLDAAIVPVRAVVETCRMTVADCTRFDIGQVIDLPGVSLQSIGLEAEMMDGSVNFGSAALGIYKSHRAVKLIEDMDPEFCPSSLAR